VQIKRIDPTTTHLVSEPAACPYCVQDNFGIVYTPPSWRSGLGSDAAVSGLSLLPIFLTLMFRFRPLRLLLCFHRHLLGLIQQRLLKRLPHIPLINDVREALVLIVQML
jgi:hypothetical protein